jgi:YjbE family integral membrane protein
MDWLSAEVLSALLAIIVIDLVLAGDNAIVIAMAARHLPKAEQKKAIFLGTAGAIVIRTAATLAVVWILRIKGLLLAGGLLLIWIAFRLLSGKQEHGMKAQGSLWQAVRTVIIADAVMGLDNVLAVAGAAHSSYALVIAGLAISVPIMVWGSSLVLKLMDKFSGILYVGAGVLAWTAGKMLTDEPLLEPFFTAYPPLKWLAVAAVIGGVLAAGWYKQRQAESRVQASG